MAGIDVGKAQHWVCPLDEQGRVILSLKVATTKPTLPTSCRRSSPAGVPVTWAVDILDTLSALLGCGSPR